MKLFPSSLANRLALGLVFLGVNCVQGHADSRQISSDRLDAVDGKGYFTPKFKAAVHGLVDSKRELEAAQSEAANLSKQVPALQKQAVAAEVQTAALRQELARYDHPEENDFNAFQKMLSDPTASRDDQTVLAQAYVWTYPNSPHAGEVQRFLQQTQKKIADEQQAVRDANAARAAERAKLLQRAQARDLSLKEWRDFLRDMSGDDLIKLLGHPNDEKDGYWTYSGAWITDARTNKKVGIQINLQAGRVLNVSEIPSPP